MRPERATIRAKIWQRVAHAHYTKPPDPKRLCVFAETCIFSAHDETFRRCRIANTYLKHSGGIPVGVVVTPFAVRRIQAMGGQLSIVSERLNVYRTIDLSRPYLVLGIRPAVARQAKQIAL